MGNKHNSDNNSEFNLEQEIETLKGKIEVVENINAVLEDKVKSYEDPSKAPRIIRRGHINKNLKFQANNVKCSPVDGHVINPVVAEPVPVKQ